MATTSEEMPPCFAVLQRDVCKIQDISLATLQLT